MSQHAGQHMVSPPRKLPHLAVIHPEIGFGFGLLKALLDGTANSREPDEVIHQVGGSVCVRDEVGINGAFSKILHENPPSPLYQRGVRGDFHASLIPHRAWGFISKPKIWDLIIYQELAMIDELEKRKFRRLERPLEVMAEIVPSQEAPKGPPRQQIMHMKSRNISKSGICLETKSIEVDGVNLLSGAPFARENRLRLIIEIIPEEPPLVATGEVRWYDIAHDIPDFICRLGVAFIEIKDGGKGQLARFLEKHQNNKGYFQKLLHKR